MDDDRQDWTLYETNDEDVGPKLWLLRDSLPAGLDAKQYPQAVVIEWTYADEGLPDAATLATMHRFEKHIGPLDSDAGHSVLVHIIRGRGVSELCFYTRDTGDFMDGFNRLMARQPRVPIAIEFLDDPGWEYRRSIRANLTPDPDTTP